MKSWINALDNFDFLFVYNLYHSAEADACCTIFVRRILYIVTRSMSILACRKSFNKNCKNCKTEMFLISSSRCLFPIHWGRVLGREWIYRWRSADRRCSNNIWVINFIPNLCATYIICFTVVHDRVNSLLIVLPLPVVKIRIIQAKAI